MYVFSQQESKEQPTEALGPLQPVMGAMAISARWHTLEASAFWSVAVEEAKVEQEGVQRRGESYRIITLFTSLGLESFHSSW